MTKDTGVNMTENHSANETGTATGEYDYSFRETTIARCPHACVPYPDLHNCPSYCLLTDDDYIGPGGRNEWTIINEESRKVYIEEVAFVAPAEPWYFLRKSKLPKVDGCTCTTKQAEFPVQHVRYIPPFARSAGDPCHKTTPLLGPSDHIVTTVCREHLKALHVPMTSLTLDAPKGYVKWQGPTWDETHCATVLTSLMGDIPKCELYGYISCHGRHDRHWSCNHGTHSICRGSKCRSFHNCTSAYDRRFEDYISGCTYGSCTLCECDTSEYGGVSFKRIYLYKTRITRKSVYAVIADGDESKILSRLTKRFVHELCANGISPVTRKENDIFTAEFDCTYDCRGGREDRVGCILRLAHGKLSLSAALNGDGIRDEDYVCDSTGDTVAKFKIGSLVASILVASGVKAVLQPAAERAWCQEYRKSWLSAD